MWILVIVLFTYHGISSFQIPNFSSSAECAAAGNSYINQNKYRFGTFDEPTPYVVGVDIYMAASCIPGPYRP